MLCGDRKLKKSQGVDNIPSELLKNGGKTTTTALTALCQKDMKNESMAKVVDTNAH